ncbi:GH3 auxin-responsive promoter family protein [Streptomyces sp. NK08204]|uniref:GH3 auxin-responsive promoter family protein n=1 Tax=Streptomyces sp. NK08204 TaxID=2873260 RepID=UPI001CEC3C88|nr:GH3 auxin-responsive promoter family protein [Streptomyces sp. NK08204]
MTVDEWAHPDRLSRYRERVLGEQRILREACGDTDGHRRRVLEDLLAFNADTEFGKKHGFRQIRELDDFRKAVPISDYAALEPWIERMAAGESGLLTSDDPAIYFTSSGTTGAHKKIPVTPRFIQTVFMPFYYAMWAPMAEHFWDVVARPDAVLNLKQDILTTPRTTASGRPHLGASQVDFGAVFGETLAAEPGTAAPWAQLPPAVSEDDHMERQYLRLRLAAENRDVQGIVAFNPAMIAALPYQLGHWWPRILKEIRDGTLGGRPHHSPNPGRAAELEQLAQYHPTVRPSLVWPRMKVILSWTTGVASLYLPRVREEFGAGVTLLPAPVGASEGPVGVALDRHPSAGSLVVTAAVHEFVDADADLAADSETLLPHELETNRDYHVVFSHVGGLYRYAMGDVVRVLDHADGVPRMEYAGRATLSDAVGERLREGQVVRALRSTLTATGLEVRNAACRVAAADGPTPYYTFAVEPWGTWSEHETSRFARLLDTALRKESSGYRQARAEGRLGLPSVLCLPEGAFQRQWDATVAGGVRFTQVKDRLFRQDSTQWRQLTGDAPDRR